MKQYVYPYFGDEPWLCTTFGRAEIRLRKIPSSWTLFLFFREDHFRGKQQDIRLFLANPLRK